MIKIFCEPEQPTPEIISQLVATQVAPLRTELEKLRQQLTDRTTLFSDILTGQQKIIDAITMDTSKTAESRLLIDGMSTMLNALTEQMADHLKQLEASK